MFYSCRVAHRLVWFQAVPENLSMAKCRGCFGLVTRGSFSQHSSLAGDPSQARFRPRLALVPARGIGQLILIRGKWLENEETCQFHRILNKNLNAHRPRRLCPA